MSCYIMIFIGIYSLLVHHFMLVDGPIICRSSCHGDRKIYGAFLQPHVWANDDVIVMMYHVFESLVHKRLL